MRPTKVYLSFLLCSLFSFSRGTFFLSRLLSQAVFDKFDRSHAGEITGRDLRLFLGKELDDSDIREMLKEAGVEHGGR